MIKSLVRALRATAFAERFVGTAALARAFTPSWPMTLVSTPHSRLNTSERRATDEYPYPSSSRRSDRFTPVGQLGQIPHDYEHQAREISGLVLGLDRLSSLLFLIVILPLGPVGESIA